MFRILVAEDDDNARFLMCEVLRRAGYEPCPARDGVEALEVMEHYQCDLAVVDITMPRMDGITFTQTLREGNCDLPVLMVTARVTQEDKRRGFWRGRMTIWSSQWTRRRCFGVSRPCCGGIAAGQTDA